MAIQKLETLGNRDSDIEFKLTGIHYKIAKNNLKSS